jgi:RHS repeat-associated protein
MNGTTIAATYYYDAFGNVTEDNTTYSNNYLYSGYQYDRESKLYYLNARHYNPLTSRFMQEDTYRGSAADPLSLNLYTYCNNNPIAYVDPTGHAPTQTYVEGGITYTNVNGNIYKDGRLIPESSYQYIPTVIGGTRDGTPSNNSGGSPANTSNTSNNNNSGSNNSGGTSYHMNSNGSITKTVNGQAYLVTTNDNRYSRVLGELNAYIGNQTGQSLRTTVGVVINNGQINWTSIGQSVTITQGDRLVATLNYNAKTGEYATSNKSIITGLVNDSLTIKKATNNVKGNVSGGKSVVVVDNGSLGNLNKPIAAKSLPPTGEPGSTGKLYNPDGSLKQERVYGPDGKALKDRDYNHGGSGHTFPHDHVWENGKRVPDPKTFSNNILPVFPNPVTIIGGVVIAGFIYFAALYEEWTTVR